MRVIQLLTALSFGVLALLVKFPFISARHPATVVLMNAAATDFSRSLLGFGFGGVEPLAVGHPWCLVHQQGQYAEAESR